MAEVKVTLADSPQILALVEAAGNLAQVADDAASSLLASDNVEVPRWAAEELQDAVDEWKKTVASVFPSRGHTR